MGRIIGYWKNRTRYHVTYSLIFIWIRKETYTKYTQNHWTILFHNIKVCSSWILFYQPTILRITNESAFCCMSCPFYTLPILLFLYLLSLYFLFLYFFFFISLPFPYYSWIWNYPTVDPHLEIILFLFGKAQRLFFLFWK